MHTASILPILLLAAAVHAEDRCVVEAKKNDRVAKGSNVTIQAGETVEDAIAVEGNVLVKKGATAKDAIALHGTVTVEPGAHLTGNAIALGGKLDVSKQAKVDGSRISLGDALHVTSDNGTDFEVALSVDGKNLAREILKPMLAKFHECGVISVKSP